MRRTRQYTNVFFTSEGIRKSFAFFEEALLTDLHKRYLVKEFVIELGSLLLEYETEEDLFKVYIPGVTTVIYKKTFLDYEFMLYTSERSTYVGLKAQTLARMVPVFQYIDSLIPSTTLTREEALKKALPLVLVIHGHDEQWKDLVSYLYLRHGYAVKPFDLEHLRIHEIRELVKLAGRDNIIAFCHLGQGDLEGVSWVEADRNLRELLGTERVVLICPESRSIRMPAVSNEAIFFAPGRIKEVFWLVLNKVRRSLA
ncbi:MAG: hypothetical protein DRH12_02970 [Deltaproteobacteria bacterium]|nr:MAG: hypothetical protein DRH12_02970 [Deltaproteobacteria bacterium]